MRHIFRQIFQEIVKDSEFADRQRNKLIFGYVILNKIYLIFYGYKLKKKQKKNSKKKYFFPNVTPLYKTTFLDPVPVLSVL